MSKSYLFKKNSISSNEFSLSSETESINNKKERKNSINSSSPESSFNNLNSEIKSILENETDLSFSSNSISEIEDNKNNIEHLFDSKYWKASKDINSDTDEFISINESQTEKDTPSKKDKYILIDKKNTKQFYKYEDIQDLSRISAGSIKQISQINDNEKENIEHLYIINNYENNNNSLGKNVSEENEKKENTEEKINIREEKINENTKENNNKTINNKNNNNNNKNNKNNCNNKQLSLNGLNNYNNIQNLKYINESDFVYPYNYNNYQNNSLPFFQGIYLSQQLYSFIPNYNYLTLNNANIITNNNTININHELNINSPTKNKNFHSNIDNNNMQNNKYLYPYMNNVNNTISSNKKNDMINIPLVLSPKKLLNNAINYRGNINYNLIRCPQIPSVINNPVLSNNISNNLPEINNNKESLSNLNDKKTKSNSNNIKTSDNKSLINKENICSIIEQNNNNNKLNIKDKNCIINKNTNILNNNKINLKGERQILNLDDIVTGRDTRTTIMIRNIPIKYTDEILIEDLYEFNGKYDCLYMPYDYEKNGNKGYAFINFVNPLHILYFYEKFNGKKWMHFESSKICELNCAHFQGINEIQKHAKNYKGQNKPSYYCRNENNGNIVIPSKYLLKLKKRFPKMDYIENKKKKIIIVKSFE